MGKKELLSQDAARGKDGDTAALRAPAVKREWYIWVDLSAQVATAVGSFPDSSLERLQWCYFAVLLYEIANISRGGMEMLWGRSVGPWW